jgi:hypothetical protein
VGTLLIWNVPVTFAMRSTTSFGVRGRPVVHTDRTHALKGAPVPSLAGLLKPPGSSPIWTLGTENGVHVYDPDVTAAGLRKRKIVAA